MCKSIFALFSASVFVLWSSLSSAASVSLVPSSSAVNTSDTFTVDLVLDARDMYGTTKSETFTGEVLIDYDPTQLDFQGFTEAVPGTTMPLVISTTSDTTLGPLNNGRDKFALTFGNLTFTTPNIGTIGTYTFMAKDMTGAALIDIADNGPLGGFGVQDPFSSFDPQDINTTVNVIPIPAAAWLMFSGLGMLGFISRRS
jgi:hypothetical protein